MARASASLPYLVLQAHAGAYFATRVLDAMAGASDVVECTFVENDLTAAPFFATPCTLGKDGVMKVSSGRQLAGQ